MTRLIALLTWLACAIVLGACAIGPRPPPPDDGARDHLVHVASNGWHTAIVVARPELVATGLLPEAGDFPNAAFLEFGWGDRAYYPAGRKTLGMTLAAVFFPTPSVVHMAGLHRVPVATGPDSEVLPVALTDLELRHLLRAIADSFGRPESGAAQAISRGLYPTSNFYAARGSFHLFNTCNTWTARMLRAGGVPISPFGVITAGELMARLRSAIRLRENRERRQPRRPGHEVPCPSPVTARHLRTGTAAAFSSRSRRETPTRHPRANANPPNEAARSRTRCRCRQR